MSAAARRQTAIRLAALGVGAVLFAATLYYVDFGLAVGTVRRLGLALPVALFFSGLWHLARTWAWAWCFQQPRKIGFARLARVRLSAEAFSYLTLRGVAGEPLKVVLLTDAVDAREATAAVALERLAYLVGTTVLVGVASVMAIAGLPLTRLWFRVFRAFAIVSAILAALTAIVIAGRGTYLQALMRRVDAALDTSFATGRIGEFAGAVERQVLDLVRGSPRRLLVLLTATVAAFVCMVLEAWVVLRAAGAPITLNGAFAVETFSRVASFASAFIPANLGALEASSVAAVAAVGATGGGAALAIARRIRGLLWAGIGLAIFPRRRPSERGPATSSPPDVPATRQSTLLYVPAGSDVAVSPWARLAGLPIVERVLLAARRARYTHIIVWNPHGQNPGGDKRLRALLSSLGGQVHLASNEPEFQAAMASLQPLDPVTVVGPGTVVSPALLVDAQTVVPTAGEMLDVPAGPDWPVSGVLRATASDLRHPGRAALELRERLTARVSLPAGEDVSSGRARLAVRIRSAAELPLAQRAIRRSSYKDTDATLARFNRRMSLPISIALIRTPITANQISVALVAMGFYSAWLFSIGHYWTGVLGGILSLAASILDGCDGEIARLKYQESALGCWIETFGDYAYYIAIFIGLTIGAVHQTGWEGFYWLGAIALLGTLASFAMLIWLRGRITAGQPQKLHAIARERFKAQSTFWSRAIWRISFVATRSAMPYGILAFALVNALPGIVVLAAIGANVYWASLLLKLRYLLAEGPSEPLAAE